MSKRIAFNDGGEKLWIDISEQTWKAVGDGLMNGDTVGESVAQIIESADVVGSDEKVDEYIAENFEEDEE